MIEPGSSETFMLAQPRQLDEVSWGSTRHKHRFTIRQLPYPIAPGCEAEDPNLRHRNHSLRPALTPSSRAWRAHSLLAPKSVLVDGRLACLASSSASAAATARSR